MGCRVQTFETGSEESVGELNNNYWMYRAEAVPQEEMELGKGDKVLHLCHVSLKDDKRVRFAHPRSGPGIHPPNPWQCVRKGFR